jgi:hypothetical protein
MPTCSSCGGDFDDTFQFCPYCGKSKPEAIKKNINLNISVAQGVNACPSCQSNNKVEKVTTIYKSQVSETRGQMPVETVHTDGHGEVYSSTGYRSYSASHSSNLAQLLAPPERPTTNSWYGCLTSYCLLQVVAASIVVGGSILFTLFYLFGSIVSSDMPFVGIIFPVIFTILFVGYWLLAFWGRKHFQNKKTDDQKQFEINTPIWQNAMKRWDNLYYCYRCDCIFIPNEPSTPSTNMHSYIYKT